MKIAVIKTGGKQYKVKEGQSLKIEKLKLDVGSKILFDTLLTAGDGGKDVKIGKPTLGELVEGKVLDHGQAKKVTVIKYKNKIRYKRTLGHRQQFTKVEINKISE